MASNEVSQIRDDAVNQGVGTARPDIADLLGIARRGWLFMAAGMTFGLICSIMILFLIPPLYKASSRIAFERTTPRYMQSNKVTNEPIIDDYDTLLQNYVISSESILLEVVRSLSLASDPDFVEGRKGETPGSRIRRMFQNIAQAWGLSKQPAEDQPIQHHSDPERIALNSLASNLTVYREVDAMSVLTIAFSSENPVKAATIANAIVDTYINQSIAEKMKSTVVARKVVQERVEELKQQAKDAERALLDYKTANHIVGTVKAEPQSEQLATLQTNLTNARIAMVDARARMERVESDPDASALFAPDNGLIAKLRQELLDLSVRANDIERLVGKDHQAAVKARRRMEEVREAIASEQRRIAGSFGKEYELARARYDELSATISRVMSEEGANGEGQARMRELEGAADTLRRLYDRMLQQSSEMNRFEAQPIIAPDARVLMRATPPQQTESSKKRWLILASGSLMGLFLGGAILLARHFPFGVFRTTQQVTYATGLPCLALPEILGSDDQASLRTGEYVLNWPYSRFSQTLRSIWATINIAQKEANVKVIGVISSNPGEGKTTAAINLAAHFGRHSASRVLLVDADFHRQSLSKSVAPDARRGLREALQEPAAFAKFVVRKERLNLDVLPCPLPDQIPNPAELLGTAEMQQLIEVARAAYDLVVIEAPPMAAIVDYKMIARHCDGFIFVAEWGKTSQRLILECLSDASALLERVLCVILNKVDPAALRSIEYYKGKQFHAYYYDQKRA
jgi:succinoglycan biosynthesis transport protein ExoP